MAPAEPSPTQRNWMELGYGLLFHFGPATFARTRWGDGAFPAAKFQPHELDCKQWVSVIADAGARYAVLTVKHYDGFCLWPSRQTPYSVGSAPGGRDVLGELASACREAGIPLGLNYSLWDRNCQFYEDDAAYGQYLREQMSELLSDYGPIQQICFDGAWDKDYPSRTWDYEPEIDGPMRPEAADGSRWQWNELYQHIHRLQPECLVAIHSSPNRPGEIAHTPVDLRSSEHFDFIHREKVCRPQETNDFTELLGRPACLPIEFRATLGPDWFWTGKSYPHPQARTIAAWYKRARFYQGNLLINVGPDARGLIPEYHREFLRAARQLMGKA